MLRRDGRYRLPALAIGALIRGILDIQQIARARVHQRCSPFGIDW